MSSLQMAQTEPDATIARERYARMAKEVESDLLRHAARLCGGDFDWAKDLAQDALIAGYTQYRSGELHEPARFKAWMIRVLTNRFINQYNRKRKWEASVDVDTLEEEGLAHSIQAPQEDLFESWLDEPLEIALKALPEDQRVCVLLVDVEQFEYAEAAAILQIPVGTVRSRLARARLRLYTLLMPYAKSRRLI